MRSALSAALLSLAACKCGGPMTASIAQWPEADALFHQEPRWLGSDAAYSIDLGNDRSLWLFGDTFVATSAANDRRESAFIRNSIAIQEGRDPTSAFITFSWGDAAGTPVSFFSEEGDRWFWPAQGARVGHALVLFLSRMKPATGGLGFALDGTVAVRVDNPDDAISAWRMSRLAVPGDPFGINPGAVFQDGGYLHLLGAREPDHAVTATRWKAADVEGGDLSHAEWWNGKGWSDTIADKPGTFFDAGQTEFSVTRDPGSGSLIEIQTVGFGAADVAWRSAPGISGPWDGPHKAFHPPESDRANALVYAAKAHPELRGADLVLTYASNSTVPGDLLTDQRLYYPRFLRLDWRR